MSLASPKNIKIIPQSQANSFIGTLQGKVDNAQLKHKPLGFIYAVLKKYEQDDGSNQAALVTYYGFLSLFPLLIVALSITQLSALHGLQLKSKVINSYFFL